MTAGPHRGKHVLVVDDCPATREILQIILAGEGYCVTSAGDGQEALRQLHHSSLPDVILLDLAMPVMDGWQFLEQKQQDPALVAVPVVVFSALGDQVERREGSAIAGCIVKPLDEDALIDQVVQAVQRLCG
jgi:CheY-like chemotaxis protein